MSDLAQRIADLSPEKRALLLARLQQASGAPGALPERIPRRAPGEPVPLSLAQQRLFFLDRLEAGSPAYHLVAGLDLEGRVDAARLRRGFEAVVARHEALRTRFEDDEGLPRAVVVARAPVPFARVDLTTLPAGRRRAELLRIAAVEAVRPFALDRPPLLRVLLVHREAARGALLFTMHHMVSDGWSLGVLVQEVGAFYAGGAALPEPSIQYGDYAAWQRRALEDGRFDADREHWRRHLEGAPPMLELPTDYPRSAVRSVRGGDCPLAIPVPQLAGLRELARGEGATLFMLLLSVFAVLLARSGQQRDLVIGTPEAGRDQPETEPLIGLFVNTLALRLEVRPGEPLRRLLRRAREVVVAARSHAAYPFDRVVQDVQPERSLSRSPLFQVMFSLDNTPQEELDLGDVAIRPLELPGRVAQMDLNVQLTETAAGVAGFLEYSADLFTATTARRMVHHLLVLLESAAADPSRAVDALPLLTVAERHQVGHEWNDRERQYRRPAPIPRRITEQATAMPDRVALVFAGHHLSYGELERRSAALASRVRCLGAGAESVVGVAAERSLALLIGLIAVLRADAAYLPLDADLPSARLAMMLAECSPPAVLVQPHLRSRLPESDAAVVELGPEALRPAPQADMAPPSRLRSAHPAYVLYTSGSTGRPKGAVISHEAILNRLLWMQEELPLAAGDRVLQKTPISFDVSVWELFWPLMEGATLVIAEPGVHRDPERLARLLVRERVGTVHFVPSMLRPFLAVAQLPRCRALRRVIASGEELTPELRDRVFERLDAELVNLYGPTEAAVDVTIWRCCRDATGRAVPLGRPIANTAVRILDPWLAPVPVGVPGELHIAGVNLARGYLGRPALTAECFVPDPSSATPGARLYRTGDLGRLRPDGAVEYLGRLDHQVKVRGFRIELGEIESVLLEHPSVAAAAVLAEDAPAGRRLAAYVVPTSAVGELPTEALRAHLAGRLPDYMVPVRWRRLTALPLTPSGKVDRHRLAAAAQPEVAVPRQVVAPRTEAERRLAEIWKDLLEVAEVGVGDGFFALGGDSIVALQMVARARRGGLLLTPQQVFQHPTLEALAAASGRAGEAVGKEEAVGPVPLTPVQRWFLERSGPSPHHFNQAVLLEPRRWLPADRLAAAVARLAARHQALRLRFRRHQGGWRSRVAPPGDGPGTATLDLRSVSPPRWHRELARAIAAVQGSLDLGRGPLLRVVRLLAPREGERLLVVIHHLAVDAYSWQVLLDDLEALLRADSEGSGGSAGLPPVGTPWSAWARSLAQRAAAPDLEARVADWSVPAAAELPYDLPGEGAGSVASAAVVEASLGDEATAALLREVPIRFRAEPRELLLTALARALTAWSGSGTVLVEVEDHGREPLHAGDDVSRTVGWFTSILPVGLCGDGGVAAAEAVRRNKQRLRSVPDRGLGPGLLRWGEGRADGLRAPGARAPVLFNDLGRQRQAGEAGGLFRLAAEPVGPTADPRALRGHLFEVTSLVVAGRLTLTWEYSRERHGLETVSALVRHTIENLDGLITACLAGGETGYTPSDFPLARLASDELQAAVGGDPGIEDLYPLSALQEGMLYHAVFAPGSDVFLEQLCLALDGELDAIALRGAWQDVVRRHPALRTSLVWQAVERPLQRVHCQVELPWQELDWRPLAEEERERRLAELLGADRRRGLPLDRAPLMRCTLVLWSERSHRLLWTYHHLLLDGWSQAVVLEEVLRHYRAGRSGRPAELPPTRPFRDMVAHLEALDPEDARAFWSERLAGLHQGTDLPFRPRLEPTERRTGPSRVVDTALDAAAYETVERFARHHGLTLNTMVQAAWALLLARYAGSADVIHGMVVAGRPAEIPQVETIVGLFINTLPVRTTVEADATPAAWLRGLQQQLATLRRWEHTPLVRVQGWSELVGNAPLFRSLVVFENYPVGRAGAQPEDGLVVRQQQAVDRPNYPLLLLALPDRRRLHLMVKYDPDRLDDDEAAQLLRHVRNLLVGLTSAASVGGVALLDAAERAQVVGRAAAPRRPLPSRRVEQWVADQAATRPGAVALRHAGHCLTFGELERQVAALAGWLRRRAGRGDVVAVPARRSPELVTAWLAVLRTGAVFLPLAPDDPPQRLHDVLVEVKPRLVLVVPGAGMQDAALPDGVPVVGWTPRPPAAPAAPIAPPLAPPPSPDELAYVVSTSGSSGRPKGLWMTHRGVLNVLAYLQHEHDLGTDDVVLQLAPPTFDASLRDLLLPLALGASVVLPTDEVAAEARQVVTAAAREAVTCLPSAVPTRLRGLAAEAESRGVVLRAVRLVLSSGEALLARDARAVRRGLAPHATLVNQYGPSECTMVSTFHRVGAEEEDPLPLGRPLANLRLHLLDERMEPVPPGAVGEIFLGGPGLSLGYVRRSAQTAVAFVPDPFSATPGERLYRTGDRAFERGGRLLFLGRADRQVKVRGFRVEPGEIEAVLGEHPAVRAVVVVPKGEARRLVAYLEARPGAVPDDAELSRLCARRLPSFLQPSSFVLLDQLPQNANGKLDRRALAALDDEGRLLEPPYTAPATPTERRLAAIWSQVLGRDRITTDVPFCNLGGNSVDALRTMARIRRLGVDLPLQTFYRLQTVQEIAAEIDRLQQAGTEPAADELVPLAREGRRMRRSALSGQRKLGGPT